MATSKRWALVVGLTLLLLVFAGATAWFNRPVGFAEAPPAPVGFAAAPSTTSAAPSSSASERTASEPAPAQSAANQPAGPRPVASQPVLSGPPAVPPHFDIVRVEPTGDTVVAGRGAPNAKVALLAQGAVVAETMSDANGHFVVLPPSLTPGDHSLSLRQTPENGAPSTSAQSVTISVPARGTGSVVVALAEPGQPTKVLSAPDAPSPPHGVTPEPSPAPTLAPSAAEPSAPTATRPIAPPPVATADAKVAVRAVDLENGDGFHASGVAKPGTPLRVYLNNAHIADVVAGPDGQWTVTIKKGLAGGHYVVRADAEQPAEPPRKTPTVTARAEVPFDVPTIMPPPAASSVVAKPVQSATSTAPAGPIDGTVGAPTIAPSTTPPSATPPSATPPSATPPDARQPGALRPTVTADAGNAVIDEIQTARVVPGDNLWNISLSRLGQATRYTQIYAANEKQIRDPNLIYPGQVFVLPR